MQLDNADRGFSFNKVGPGDRRMDTSRGQTALDLIRQLTVDELITVLKEWGEERFAVRIARRLKDDVRDGKIGNTLELADAVAAVIPGKAKRLMRIHPATKTFQALRIAVNRELEELEQFLASFPALLRHGGRCVIISFHSLEDRLVKRCFRDLAWSSSLPPDLARQAGERVDPVCKVLTRKPVFADDDEIEGNPRARSARLRACEKVGDHDQ
jgi:16S rRNA (cytosine1402-N4)-methyltransferase